MSETTNEAPEVRAPPVETFTVYLMAADQVTKETLLGGANDQPSAVAIACAGYAYLQTQWMRTGRMIQVFDGTGTNVVAWLGVQYT
jgi:hypothetical protein